MAGESQPSEHLPANPRSSLEGDTHRQTSRVPYSNALGISGSNVTYSWRSLAIATAAFIPVLVPAILLGCLVYFATQPPGRTPWFDAGCDPLGNVWTSHRYFTYSGGGIYGTKHNVGRPSLWNVDYALTINVGFGHMSFSLAKGIDVVWDFVVGRGSQVLCSVALYYIFRRPIAEAFQQPPRSYDALLAMQYSTASVTSLVSYAEYTRLLARERRRQCMATALLVISTGYTLLLPTLLSAMSGYQAKSHPMLPIGNHTYVAFSKLRNNCEFLIEDGHRIGLNDNFCVARTSPEESAFNDYYTWLKHCGSSLRSTQNETAVISYCDAASNLTISGQTFHLDAPSLHYMSLPGLGESWEWEATPGFYSYNNHGYTIDFLRDYGQCQPSQFYQWGFSFLLAVGTLVWTLALFAVLYVYWVTTRARCDAAYTKRVFGRYQTAIAVAEQITQDTAEVDGKITSFTNNGQAKPDKGMQVASTPLLGRS